VANKRSYADRNRPLETVISENLDKLHSHITDIMDASFEYKYLTRIEKRFVLCCQQITLLDEKMDALQIRYMRANRRNVRCSRYSLRLQFPTMEGMRNIFYEYAKRKGLEIAETRRELFHEDVEVHDYVEIPDWEDM